ncbi:hypothetical protein VU08_04420 [Desulfobulbus sp. F5]|nr:hypothetical protein [Desulfobulbus sp. F5]
MNSAAVQKDSFHSWHHALSNVQMELVKLYSTNLDDNELTELKQLLADHFSSKAISEANRIWMQNGMTAQTMDDWLNEE